ncbi:TonB-dependent receptor domain-containing protein [Dysgonomonas macrotermitis]|uniref:Outer membrane receptor proteins, mostly Fe transport n=1 Tax=Dysgonomonas macrotermitis TaxID=1346286 RepID=A0A1M5HU48_9BACT|nr:outer membrane beta-barrel family protein [Dysgonomonas macrotermitis]SHG19491.1 Outer membrane receptor proteins, mostly Fe transport [Dysgonomonas macrotermitis]
MKIIRPLYLLMLLLPITAFSQTSKVTVKGVVMDSLTQETIPYATIRITPAGKPSVLEKAVVTDDGGAFNFAMTKKGEFVLNIQYLGKEPVEKAFSVGSGNTVDLGNIFLRGDKTTLSEVVVSAQRPLVKVDMDKITYSLEDDPDSKTSNVMDMLRKVPMVTIDAEDNIELKGSTSYKIYLDGKPSSMLASNPKDVLKSMPASSIKNIEVITDPGPKYDAEGLAGIINIITNKETSMGGYTATLNGRADTRGGYGLGGFLSFKKGKLGFTGNYNYYDYKSPWSNMSSSREYFGVEQRHFVETTGRNKYSGNGQYGGGELSYEIDTLNLVNIGFSKYGGDGTSKSYGTTKYADVSNITQQEYNQNAVNDYTYGSTSVKVDYQNTSAKNKDRLFTASYRYQTSPDDWASRVAYENVLAFRDFGTDQYSDGSTKEHTFQVDYTTPFSKIHTLEAGLKYIIRLSDSRSGRQDYDPETGVWTDIASSNDKFKHEQDIFSAYLGYTAKIKKWGFKAGARYEGTNLEARFPLDSEQNFKTDYSNIVPSATVSYQLATSQTIRLGYNMRISRPGIWQLNPYVNSSDTTTISYGNPDLDAVKSHNINLNYSLFTPKFNMNTSVSYNIVNNSVEDVTRLEGNTIIRTYGNVGKKREVSLFNYVSWTPMSKIRFTANTSVGYTDIRGYGSPGEWMTNTGFTGRLFTNFQYTFPQAFKFSAGFGGRTGNVNLLGKRSGFSYHSFGLSKSFLADKLTFNVSAVNPFQKELKFTRKEHTTEYLAESINYNKNQSFNFSVSYRFGEMKAQIKKAARSINNDDAMGGGSAEQSGGGQQ